MVHDHPCGGERGLHNRKVRWIQKSYLAEHCRALVENIDEEIAATFREAPVRSAEQTYRLDPRGRLLPEEMGQSQAHPGLVKPSEERLLEAALFEKYGRGAGLPVPPLWDRLVGYQIPLFDQQERGGWGYIDLLGLGCSGEPVIVELKRAGSADTPLHALLEAASYAVALRKNWGVLAKELAEIGVLTGHGPHTWGLVLLAPGAYWDSWGRQTAKGRRVSEPARIAYRDLCDAFGLRGYPVRLGQVAGIDEWDGETVLDPEQVDVSEITRPWFE